MALAAEAADQHDATGPAPADGAAAGKAAGGRRRRADGDALGHHARHVHCRPLLEHGHLERERLGLQREGAGKARGEGARKSGREGKAVRGLSWRAVAGPNHGVPRHRGGRADARLRLALDATEHVLPPRRVQQPLHAVRRLLQHRPHRHRLAHAGPDGGLQPALPRRSRVRLGGGHDACAAGRGRGHQGGVPCHGLWRAAAGGRAEGQLRGHGDGGERAGGQGAGNASRGGRALGGPPRLWRSVEYRIVQEATALGEGGGGGGGGGGAE